MRRLGLALFVCGAAAVAFATLTPSDQQDSGAGLCLICGDFAGVDALLNILLFVPIGAGLALAGVRGSRAIPIVCAAAVLIEALQLFAIAGRDASVADVLSNSIGAVLGFVVAARASGWLLPTARNASRMVVVWMAFWILVQGLGSYVLRPDPTNATYHGQIARELGGRPAFAGLVLRATANGEFVPDHALQTDQASRLRMAFAAKNGVRTEMTVVVDTLTSWLSPIVRIADRMEREILLMASDGTDFVFGVRTRAARLRIRPALYRLPRAFAREVRPNEPESPDTTFARAAYSWNRVTIESAIGRTARAGSIRLTPGGFWRFIFPMQWYADGGGWNRAMDAIWLFVLLAPAGYWAAFALPLDVARGGRWAFAGAFALALAAGFVAVPACFRVAIPAWTEAAAGMCGLLAGALSASLMKKRLARSTNLERIAGDRISSRPPQ